ncbi:MAG: class I SAM-dependent methyltransferase [Actinobacteria bacterium]|nr:class I SAM-dependent methyltransferase [Actinomycetota bacterium]
MQSTEDIQSLIRRNSLLPDEEREQIISKRFAALPKRLLHALRRWPLETSAVLDIGCSYGHCLIHFGPSSVGVDNVPEHVDFCRSLGLDARLTDVDTGLGTVEDGAFDLIWVSDVLEHLDAPRHLLREAASKLRPDGRLILFCNVLPRSRVARRLFQGHGWFDADVHHYQFTVETARHLLNHAGLAVEQIVPHGLPSSLSGLERPLTPFVPVVFIEARPDAELLTRALAAERRNKPPVQATVSLPQTVTAERRPLQQAPRRPARTG